MTNVVRLSDYRQQDAPTFIDRPSPAMARWLALGAADPNGRLPEYYAPYHRVMIRTIRACVWREWARETIIGYDEGCVGGVHYRNPIIAYHITESGRAALHG